MCSNTLFRVIPFFFGISATATLAGFSVTRTGAYRGIIWTSWAVMVIGWGLMTTLDDYSNT